MATYGSGLPPYFACVDDVDLEKFRALDTATLQQLVSCHWISFHQNALLLGPSGIGKTHLSSALFFKALEEGYSALYLRLSSLHPYRSKAPLALGKLMSKIKKANLLVVDDFEPDALPVQQQDILVQVLDSCREQSSVLLISRLPIHMWSCDKPLECRLNLLLSNAIVLLLRTKPCCRHID